MASLRKVDEQIFSLLETSAAAFRSLSAADAQRATNFERYGEKFLKTLYNVQEVLRGHIDELGRDLPFENDVLRRNIEADLILQGNAHIYRGFTRALKRFQEVREGGVCVEGEGARNRAQENGERV